jgi:hypothetical protein
MPPLADIGNACEVLEWRVPLEYPLAYEGSHDIEVNRLYGRGQAGAGRRGDRPLAAVKLAKPTDEEAMR